MTDPPHTYVVRIADLDRTPLVDTRGRPVSGRAAEVKHGNMVAIVKTEIGKCLPES